MEAGQKAEVQLSELGERIERLTAHRMIPGTSRVDLGFSCIIERYVLAVFLTCVC